MTFKVGDRVVVNPNCMLTGGGIFHPNVLYTIIETTSNDEGYQRVRLKEYPDQGWWAHERFALSAEPKTKPHKWAKEIIAYAHGAEIEYRFRNGGNPCKEYEWSDWKTDPRSVCWFTSDCYEYRIKPEKKPDCHVPLRLIPRSDGQQGACLSVGTKNMVAIFDGETGNLKKVELL